jgi:hypothetical protein
MAGGMATWRPTLRYRRKVTIIALSNKYDKRVYKVRKLSALFGIILSISDFEKGMICDTIKRKQMADFN